MRQLPCQADHMFVACWSLGYFGVMCTETDVPNWWNRQYLVSTALQVMTWEAL